MKNIINTWLDKNGTKEINKKVEMEAERYNKLISDFENMEGITSSMFDEKDWIKFERFVERQEKENQEDLNNKDNWEFERSSGYAGYRNEVTGDWIHKDKYLEKFAEKDNYNGKLEIKWISDNIQCKQVESCYNSLSKKCVCPKEEWSGYEDNYFEIQVTRLETDDECLKREEKEEKELLKAREKQDKLRAEEAKKERIKEQIKQLQKQL